MFRLLSISAASILLFFSCKKDEDLPVAPGDRLKMIRYQQGDTIWFRSFQYDVQNKLTAMVDSGHGGIYRRNISYGAQGNLLSAAINGDLYTFELNSEGRVIRTKSTVQGQQSPTVRNSYGYDSEGKIISDSIHGYWSTDVWGVVSFLYDGNNNVIESKLTSATPSVQVVKQCTYDKQRNPLYSHRFTIYVLEAGYGYGLPQGKNNILKERFEDGSEVSYQYEYYSNGLPRRYSLHDSSDPLVSYVDYYYE
jgi:hypothetical protein